MLAKFMKDESGATAIEYAILTALIAVALVGAVSVMGDKFAAIFSNIAEDFTPPV